MLKDQHFPAMMRQGCLLSLLVSTIGKVPVSIRSQGKEIKKHRDGEGRNTTVPIHRWLDHLCRKLQSMQKFLELVSLARLGTMAHACHPSYLGGWDQKDSVQGQHRQIIHETLISKITPTKWIRGVTQAIEHLLCEHKAWVQTSIQPKNINFSKVSRYNINIFIFLNLFLLLYLGYTATFTKVLIICHC
jgi:hypothetical protein